MKLHNETVSPRLIRCLKTIMQSDIFKDFNLVGGTCLSLQLGHRRSIDIDLFTAIDYGSMNTTAMKVFLQENFPYSENLDSLDQPWVILSASVNLRQIASKLTSSIRKTLSSP